MSPTARYERELWITALLGILMLAVVFVGALRGSCNAPSASWIRTHAKVTSPAGYHCWNELNATQPDGLETVCAAGGYR